MQIARSFIDYPQLGTVWAWFPAFLVTLHVVFRLFALLLFRKEEGLYIAVKAQTILYSKEATSLEAQASLIRLSYTKILRSTR